MKKYRKKPVVIEAIQFTANMKEEEFKALLSFVGGNNIAGAAGSPMSQLTIKTLEGNMLASDGDYIIKGVNGEFYPCKPDIFEKTYDEETDNKSGMLKQAATPLIKLLCEEYHPHCTAIVTPTGVELLEAVATAQNIYDHIVD